MQTNQLKGVLVMLVTVLIWGGMFPVAKGALLSLDAFWLSSIRYGVAAPMLVAILYWREGAAALRYRGKFLQAAFYGIVGFSGFSILVLAGLSLSRPEHAAIIMALQTPIAAFVHWAFKGTRPANFTLVCISVAILGVYLVITKGDPAHAFAGGTLLGDLMIFLGALSWIAYTIGAVSFPGWSALRFTALTSVPGAAGILVITAIAALGGYTSAPAMRDRGVGHLGTRLPRDPDRGAGGAVLEHGDRLPRRTQCDAARQSGAGGDFRHPHPAGTPLRGDRTHRRRAGGCGADRQQSLPQGQNRPAGELITAASA